MKKKKIIIEEQGEKQMNTIQNQGEIKTIKKYACSDKDSPLISKQKEIFNKLLVLLVERLEKITKFNI